MIEIVPSYKYLGHIDESRRFETHVARTVTKLRTGMAVLYRMRHQT